MKKNQSLLLPIAIVVAAGIGFVVWKTGLYPPREGVEGAIGAAKRHTETQIADRDVTLRDPTVQSFLQSDLFHKISTNAQFRTLAAKGEFARLMTHENMMTLASQEDMARVVNKREF